MLDFTPADIIFHKFLELHTASEKNIFVENFPFWRIHSNPSPLMV